MQKSGYARLQTRILTAREQECPAKELGKGNGIAYVRVIIASLLIQVTPPDEHTNQPWSSGVGTNFVLGGQGVLGGVDQNNNE